MMTIFSAYIAGAYLTMVIFMLLLNIDSFRNYIADLIDVGKHLINMSDYHAYSLMSTMTMLLGLLSWVGIGILLYLIIDFFEWVENN